MVLSWALAMGRLLAERDLGSADGLIGRLGLKVPLMLGLLEIVSIEDLITDGSELGIGNASLVVTVEVLELGKTLDAVPGSLEGLSDGALLGAVLGLLLGNADDIVLVSETYLSTDQDSALPVGSYLVPTKAQSKGVEMVLTTEE